MPRISFLKGLSTLDVPLGANLMKALLEGGRPVASSCRGDGVCGKCRVRVVEGSTNLTKPTPLERTLFERESLAKDERVSCQTRVRGDIVVDTGYW